MVIQDASEAAVHEHAWCVRISTLARSPAAASGLDGAETLYSQGAPFCPTSTRCSPTTIAPRRTTGSALATTRNATEPSPWPSLLDVISIHGTSDADDHVHSREAPMATEPVPPPGPNAGGGPPTDS
jgi:hypothetical protein